MSEEEAASYEALKAEYEKLEEDHADADDEVDVRLGEIETTMEALQERPIRFEDEDRAIAGVFVSIDGSGRLRVERGYVRPEDEPVEATEESFGNDPFDPVSDEAESSTYATAADAAGADEEEDDGLKPLSDRLVGELTAHRTLALRDALAGDPQVAFLAALHAMVLRLFYRYGLDSCVEIEPRSTAFGSTCARARRDRLCAVDRPAHRELGEGAAQGSGGPLGRPRRVRRRQPRRALRPLRGDDGEHRARAVQPPPACARPCRRAGGDGGA